MLTELTIEGVAAAYKAHLMTQSAAEDWIADQCSIAAHELVGPNSTEYGNLVDNSTYDALGRFWDLIDY